MNKCGFPPEAAMQANCPAAKIPPRDGAEIKMFLDNGR